MSSGGHLTAEELAVIDLTADLANAFWALEPMHPADSPDVVFHVHAIQSIVMHRAAMRAHPDKFPVKRARTPDKRTSPDDPDA